MLTPQPPLKELVMCMQACRHGCSWNAHHLLMHSLLKQPLKDCINLLALKSRAATSAAAAVHSMHACKMQLRCIRNFLGHLMQAYMLQWL